MASDRGDSQSGPGPSLGGGDSPPGTPGEVRGGPASDEDLLVAAGLGAVEAFAELVRRHNAAAYRTAYRFLGDSEDARDIAQETFLHLLRAAAAYTPRAPFRSFFYRILSNLCADHRKRRRPVAVAELPDPPSQAPGPADAFAASEREEAVRRSLQALPERQRMAVVLRYYEGLSYADMARALETSEKGAERLLARGRGGLLERLAPLLGPAGGERKEGGLPSAHSGPPAGRGSAPGAL